MNDIIEIIKSNPITRQAWQDLDVEVKTAITTTINGYLGIFIKDDRSRRPHRWPPSSGKMNEALGLDLMFQAVLDIEDAIRSDKSMAQAIGSLPTGESLDLNKEIRSALSKMLRVDREQKRK